MDNLVTELKNTQNFLLTGCSKLDSFLKGGISRKGVTQIYGTSGTGKTQLALQLCLTAQIPVKNLNDIGGAVYISTEASFPSNRLHQLLKKINFNTKYTITKKKIFIQHISKTDDLENCICNPKRLQNLLSQHKIKLLVIDSIAATYRIEYNSDFLKNRAKSLRNIGYQLHTLSNIHNMAIVCINQVTPIIGNNSVKYLYTKEQPALGITWANMITNSLHMYRINDHRYLHIIGSPYLPSKTVEYEILDSGITLKNKKEQKI